MQCERSAYLGLWYCGCVLFHRTSNYWIVLGEKMSVNGGACGPNENLKERLSFCRYYPVSLVDFVLMLSAMWTKIPNFGDSILAKFLLRYTIVCKLASDAVQANPWSGACGTHGTHLEDVFPVKHAVCVLHVTLNVDAIADHETEVCLQKVLLLESIRAGRCSSASPPRVAPACATAVALKASALLVMEPKEVVRIQWASRLGGVATRQHRRPRVCGMVLCSFRWRWCRCVVGMGPCIVASTPTRSASAAVKFF